MRALIVFLAISFAATQKLTPRAPVTFEEIPSSVKQNNLDTRQRSLARSSTSRNSRRRLCIP